MRYVLRRHYAGEIGVVGQGVAETAADAQAGLPQLGQPGSAKLWTGQPAPLEVMGGALVTARAGGLRSAEGEPTGEPIPVD